MTRHPVTEMHLVLQTPAMQQVVVERDVQYGESRATPHRLDIYRPAAEPSAALPAVVFVTGYPDAGSRSVLGCALREMVSYMDWAHLVASTGIAAVLYENDEPVQDAKRLLRFIAQNAERLHIDATRLGVWACSGNVPNALALLEQHHGICCAALCYGFMPDGSSGDEVVRAGSEWGFATPPVSSELRDFPRLPVLVARAGRDEMPGLNASIDRFVRAARQADLPVTEFTQPEGRHAFDVMDDTNDSRDAIRQIVDFLGEHLLRQ